MQTSTPVGSPLRRVLHSKDSLLSLEENPEYLESELRNRRLDAINKSSEQRRKSTAPLLLAGYNAAQLADHCKDCIKLSAENKINSKNAFSFLLIDFMAAMTKKSDSEISKNLQVASSTLDASVKIYGYRVDAVHSDAMKIAGGFLGKEMREALEADEGDDNNDDFDKPEVKGKPKKKRRKMTVVAPSSLNAKSETEVLLDSLPKPNFLSKNASLSLLLKRIPKYNDGCLLMVESDAPCWPHGNNRQLVPKYEPGDVFQSDELMKLFNDISVMTGTKICEAVSSIEFGKEVEEAVSDLELTQTSNFEFDVNAVVADDSFGDQEEPQRFGMPVGGYGSEDEISRPILLKKAQSASVAEMKRRLSTQPMEYSMFDEKLLKAWAGPTYWKVRPSKEVIEANKENDELSRPVASKRTRRGKVKEQLGLFDIPEETVSALLQPCEKTVLSMATVANWKSSTFTLAEDYKYSVKQLYTLFQLPLVTAEPRKGPIKMDDPMEEENNSFEANPVPDELEYCSSMVIDDNEVADDPETEQPNKSAGEVEVWDAENMVAVPNKVQKITVNAFHRKKHVDIRHLKKCIWNVLTSGLTEKGFKVAKAVGFSNLLTICPTELPKSLAACVNPSLMFNALLHLTNEKSLVLQQTEKISEIIISQ